MDYTGSSDEISVRIYNEDTDYEEVFGIENSRLNEAYSASVFLRQAAVLHPSTFIVVEMNNRITGYAIGAFVHDKPGSAWVIRMVVHPGFRQKGVGKKLFGTLLSCLAAKGAFEILLSVSPDNLPARRIYRHYGFQTVNEIKDYFGEGEDRLIKRLVL
jgi:ribosomal-protein-alanine N-acetyltransferase